MSLRCLRTSAGGSPVRASAHAYSDSSWGGIGSTRDCPTNLPVSKPAGSRTPKKRICACSIQKGPSGTVVTMSTQVGLGSRKRALTRPTYSESYSESILKKKRKRITVKLGFSRHQAHLTLARTHARSPSFIPPAARSVPIPWRYTAQPSEQKRSGQGPLGCIPVPRPPEPQTGPRLDLV